MLSSESASVGSSSSDMSASIRASAFCTDSSFKLEASSSVWLHPPELTSAIETSARGDVECTRVGIVVGWKQSCVRA